MRNPKKDRFDKLEKLRIDFIQKELRKRTLQNKPKKLTKEELKERKKKYSEYLDSKAWQTKRNELFALRGKKCERCGSEKFIQVHHITYKTIFNEDLRDLEVLCKYCHKKEHSRGKNNRKKLKKKKKVISSQN